jgi:uncharacterized protein DUF4034
MKLFLKTGFCAFVLITASILMTTGYASGQEFTDGSPARNELTKQIKQLFQDGKFAELDDMADKYRSTKARFPDGQWKLMVFFTAFEVGTNTPEWVYPTYITLAEKWRRSFPESVTAQCVLAGLWTDYAWKARGGGYATEVKEQAWPLVRERLDKAWEIVNEPLVPNVADSPRRHNLRLVIAKARGIEKEQFDILFNEAVQQAPDYYHHYTTKADYLLPKWHGEEGDWQRFIAKVAEQNPHGEGATIYARTAWSMFLGKDWTDFKDSGVSWAKMKAGFREIDHNYPNSPWILNTFARFACRAGDIETMKVLFERIDPNRNYPEAWEKDNIEDCRSWVKLGKSKQEIEKEKIADHMKRFEAKVFQNVLELAEKGNRQVIGDLADMYLNGRGTTTDPVAAYAWLLQDESTYKDQLAINIRNLTSEQLRQARDKAEVIRDRISKQTK